MSTQNVKKEEYIFLPENLVNMRPSEADFVIRCANNDECRELIETAMPKLAVDGDRIANILKVIGLYGTLSDELYNKVVNNAHPEEMNRWDRVFIRLMNQLRELL